MVDRVRAGEVRVDFTGRATEFQAAARRASSALRRQQRQLTLYQRVARSANVQNRALTAGFALIGGIVSVRAVQGLARLSDESRQLEGRLGLVTGSSEELVQTWEDLAAVANETSASYGDTIGVYVRLRQSLADNVATSAELTDVVRTLNQAVALSGVSGEAARAALVQLGQGFAAGALRGEELNSVLEQTPAVAQAIAAGLGVSVGALRGLAAQGALTAEAVFGALQEVAGDTAEAYESLPRTIGRAIQELNNELFNLFRASDEASDSTTGIVSAIDDLAESIRNNTGAITSGISSLINVVSFLTNNVRFLLAAVGGLAAARGFGALVSALGLTAAATATFRGAVVGATRSVVMWARSLLSAAAASRAAAVAELSGASSATASAAAYRATAGVFREFAALQRRALSAFVATGAAILAGIPALGLYGAAVGVVSLALYGLYSALRAGEAEFRSYEAAQAASTDALVERRRQLLLTITAETALGETVRDSRQEELDLLNRLITARRLVAIAGTGDQGGAAAGFDADISAGGAAFFEGRRAIDDFIARAREASIVAQSAALDAQRLSGFDPSDPARAALEARLAGEREFAAVVRQQQELLRSGNAEQMAAATEFLAQLSMRRDAYEDILAINEQIARQAQEARNAEAEAAGVTAAARFEGGLQNDVLAAARANNRASQLSGFDANDPARAALEAELEVLDRLQARYDELRLTVATSSGEAAIAAQAEIDALMMQESAVQALAQARGVEAGAAQAAANRTRELAREQQRAAALSMELARSFESAAESIIFDSGGAREAVVALAEEILRAIVRALIIRPLIAGLTGGLGLPGFQQGGFTSGGPAVVGENGPELVDFNRPARIYSNSESRELFGNAGGGGGGFVQNLTFNVADGASRAEVEQAILIAAPQIRDSAISAMTRGLSRPSRTRTIVSGR